MTDAEYKKAFAASLRKMNQEIPGNIRRAIQRVKRGEITCTDAFTRLTNDIGNMAVAGSDVHVIGTEWQPNMYEAFEEFGKACVVNFDAKRWNSDAPLAGARRTRRR